VKSTSVLVPADDACCHRNRDSGFTLVEVMVALTILSLVMMATVTGLRTLANTQVAIERMTDRVDEVRSVSSFLRDLLESATVGSDSGQFTLGGGSSDESYFRSGTNFLELESTVLFGERYGGTYLVRVAKEGGRLMLRWQEALESGVQPEWEDKPSRVMVDQLEELKVSTRKDYGQEWVDSMDGVESPRPMLVRLNVKAEGRYWPDLIVQVKQ
jgi:general secretion pathway protein J